MGLIDFTQFVNELATLSGQAILPFFRTAIAHGGQVPRRRVRPGHRGRPGRRSRPCASSSSAPSRPTASSARNSAPRTRDAEYVWVLDPIDGTRAFIAGLPDLGHPDRADPQRPAGLRHDAPALHRRTLLRRRRQRHLSGAGRRAQAQDAPLRLAQGRDDLHHQPADSSPATSCAPMTGSRASRGSPATAAIATPIACWRPAISTSWSNPASSPTTSSP